MISERGILTSSLRRITASRANGARSQGPITPAGKARSSRNATRHGLLSRQSITPDQSDTAFQEIFAGHLRCFAAVPGVNPRILHQMALCRWRISKARMMEKQWLDELIAADPHPDPRRQVANAFATLSEMSKYRLLFRYEDRLFRFYDQSLQTLLRLQTKNDESNLIALPETLQIETEPPQPIRAPETKNDESNLIPFSNTAQTKPEPHVAPLHVKVYVDGAGDHNGTLQIQCLPGFSGSFRKAGLAGRMPSVATSPRPSGEFVAQLVDSKGPVAGDPAWEHLNLHHGSTGDRIHWMAHAVEPSSHAGRFAGVK